MNFLYLIQLTILYLFNFNLESVNCIVVRDDLHHPLITPLATTAPLPLLVLPNPTTIEKLADPSKPYQSSSNIEEEHIHSHGHIPIHLQKPPHHEIKPVLLQQLPHHEIKPIHLEQHSPHHEEYKNDGDDKTFVEKTLNDYEARHSDKSIGDNKNLEHKSSKKGGKNFHVSEKGAKGESNKEDSNKQYEDEGGKDHEDYDEDSNSDQHHNHHGGEINSKFNKKNSDNKRRFEKGFHNKYHKKEHRKLDDFFNNYNENGDFVKYGVKKSKHNKVYKNSKKGARKSQKGSNSKVSKKGSKTVKPGLKKQ